MDKKLIVTRLRYFYASNSRLPSYGEMCKLLGYKSKGAVSYVVKALIEDEIIAKDAEGKLMPKNLMNIPLLGRIKAGYPVPAEVMEDRVFNFHHLFSDLSTDAFALTVSGDSMIDAGIVDGDIVIVDRTYDPKVGDVVAACVDNEWTVKYLQKDGAKFTLQPANGKYPEITPRESLQIGGVVVHVIRSYK